MAHVRLERFAWTPFGAFGRLTLPGHKWFTVERPWLDNQPRISCIPTGTYKLILGVFNKGGYPAYEIVGVENRSLIKIHIANVYTEVLGCIGPGKNLGEYKDKWAVLDSAVALREFMDAMDEKNGSITVCNTKDSQ